MELDFGRVWEKSSIDMIKQMFGPTTSQDPISTVVEETKRAGRPACKSMHKLPARLFLPSHTRSYRLFPHILKRHLMPSPLMLLMSTFLLKRWQDWPVPAVHLDMRRRNRSLELSPHDYCKSMFCGVNEGPKCQRCHMTEKTCHSGKKCHVACIM